MNEEFSNIENNEELEGKTDESVNPETKDDTALENNTEIENSKSEKVSESEAEKKPKKEELKSDSEDASGKDSSNIIPSKDYSEMAREKLLSEAKKLVHGYPVNLIKAQMLEINSLFNKKLEEEQKKIYENFISEGGREEDFLLPNDELQIEMHKLNSEYNNLKGDLLKKLEEEKKSNLEAKYAIVEKIKELTTGEESLNETYDDFRKLQQEWREIGLVPQGETKSLWESYNHTCELFYDYLKINKEFRDLDFKKNLEAKIELCEKAEDLILSKDIVSAYKELQELHDKYKEIGPVPRDKREEIWLRFKDATTKINKKHQEFFVNLKEKQKENVDLKNSISSQIEEISEINETDPRKWQTLSEKVKSLQNEWRKAGSVPKKYNKEVFDLYKAACDKFYNAKREFFAENKEMQKNNLQRKYDLITQVEALKDSEDWEKATADIISFQKEWKKIGAIPKGQSEKVWKKFRAACDHFFNRKKEFFGSLDEVYAKNLEEKEALIKKLSDFKPSGNSAKDIEVLKEIQKSWANIGFVPRDKKKEVQDKFRELINEKFDKIDADTEQVEMLKYKTRIDNITAKPRSDKKIDQERDKLIKKLVKLKEEVKVEENNIEFFSVSGKASPMLDGFRKRIEDKKTEIELLQNKIDMIDDLD